MWIIFYPGHDRTLSVRLLEPLVCSVREILWLQNPGPEVIKLFSCSTLLSMKCFLLINVKMPTIVGILTFMSRQNSIIGLSDTKKDEFLDTFCTYERSKFHAHLS